MKKSILSLAIILIILSANAQSKFEVKNLGNFKLHSYITADPLGDMSYIIEGKESVVVLEPAAHHQTSTRKNPRMVCIYQYLL